MEKTQSRQNTTMNAIKKAPISLEALAFDKLVQSGLIIELKHPWPFTERRGPPPINGIARGTCKQAGIFIIYIFNDSRC